MALTASIALLHWLDRTMPRPPLPEPVEPFKVYMSPVTIPSPYSKQFLAAVVAACEREWNQSPPGGCIAAGGGAA